MAPASRRGGAYCIVLLATSLVTTVYGVDVQPDAAAYRQPSWDRRDDSGSQV